MNTQSIKITKTNNPETNNKSKEAIEAIEAIEATTPLDPLSISLNRLENRIKKIQEAQDFLEDIGDRLYWALDFSECKDATDPINEIVDAVNRSQDKLQDSSEKLEAILEEFQEKKTHSIQKINGELCQTLSSF